MTRPQVPTPQEEADVGKERMVRSAEGKGEMLTEAHRDAPEFAGSSTPGPWCLGCASLIPGHGEFW